MHYLQQTIIYDSVTGIPYVNGKPAVYFNGNHMMYSSRNYFFARDNATPNSDLSIFWVGQLETNSNGGFLVGQDTRNTVPGSIALQQDDVNTNLALAYDDDEEATSSLALPTGQQILASTIQRNGSDRTFSVNQSTDVNTQTLTDTRAEIRVSVGSRIDFSRRSTCYVQEIYLFNEDKTSEKSTIDNALNSYFNIWP